MTTPSPNPYGGQLGHRDPLEVLAETLDVLRGLTTGWREQDFERSYAPGKWTARQILLHLVQTDLVLGMRMRLCVNGDTREIQPFDQDRWVARESGGATGSEVLAGFFGVRHVNLALVRSFSPDERALEMQHPERGTITIDWMVRMMAGHDVHHRGQLLTVGAGR